MLLQSEMSSTFLRSYQPYSLVMADCKALAPIYRTILTDTSLFRGLNALARHNHLQPLMQPAAKPSSPTPPSPPCVIILGYAVHRLTQLASQRGKDLAVGGNDLSASFRELGVGDSAVGESEVTEMRCIVECVRHLMGLRREGGGGVAESDWVFAEEVLRGVWEAAFHHTDPTVRSEPPMHAMLHTFHVSLLHGRDQVDASARSSGPCQPLDGHPPPPLVFARRPLPPLLAAVSEFCEDASTLVNCGREPHEHDRKTTGQHHTRALHSRPIKWLPIAALPLAMSLPGCLS